MTTAEELIHLARVMVNYPGVEKLLIRAASEMGLLQQDKARLDWLNEEKSGPLVSRDDFRSNAPFYRWLIESYTVEQPTVREAIDAHMMHLPKPNP